MTAKSIRESIESLSKKVVERVEEILVEKCENIWLVDHPLIFTTIEDESCTADRVYLMWDKKHVKCHAMVDYSGGYSNGWLNLKELPIETTTEILEILENFTEEDWEVVKRNRKRELDDEEDED